MSDFKNTISRAALFLGLLVCVFAAPNSTAAQGKVTAVPVYRMLLDETCIISCEKYVDAMTQHFYTKNADYHSKLLSLKTYIFDEGIEFYVMPASVPDAVPLYKFDRSFKPDGSGDTSNLYAHQEHIQFFQQDAQAPKGHFIKTGSEPFGYVLAAKTVATVPLYKLFRPFKSSSLSMDEDYFYTTNAAEKDKAVKSGYIDKGIVGYVWKTPVSFDPNAPKFDKDARIYLINKAFRQVYGRDSAATEEAYWLSVWHGNINAFGDIVSVETKKLNANPAARDQMIDSATKVSFGRAAANADFDEWRTRKEVFSDIVKANTLFLYSPEGANELTATIRRYLIEKDGLIKPSDKEIKAVLNKVFDLKWNFSAMHNL